MSNLNSLKAGDIIRYKPGNNHTIFVTAVNGDVITFGDCNMSGPCQIRWNQTIKKSEIKGLEYVLSAPYEMTGNRDPEGYFDSAVGGEGYVTVSGWAVDRDTPDECLDVHIYMDGPAGSGECIGSVRADQPRPDVNEALGVSGNHGFSANLPVNKTGEHTFYAYAINQHGNNNPQLANTHKTTIKNKPEYPAPSKPNVYSNYKYYAQDAKVDIMWDAIVGVSNYHIDIYENGEHVTSKDLGTSTLYTAICFNATYDVFVTASNEKGSAQSDMYTFYCIKPEAPTVRTNHKYYAPDSNIDIMWDAVEGATYYWIDIYRDGEHVISENVGNVTLYTNESHGKDYEVYVSACNDIGGWSSTTSDVCKFYLREMISPTIDINFDSYIRESEGTISWNAIEGAVGYWLDIYRDGEHIISSDLGNATSYTDIFLGKDYEIYITAYNNIGGETKATSEPCKFHLYKYGDANEDNEINIADIVILQKWLLGESNELTCWQNVDLCKDGVIDVFDMAMLRRLLIEKGIEE